METAAIVGAGASGLLHTLAYRAYGVRVVQVFDPSREKAEVLASMCGAQVIESLDAIATDIVSITSPPRWHVSQALAMRERIVFVEKPVATTLEELDALQTHPRCVPIVQWRSGRALRGVRRAIASGLFGRRPSVSVDLAWSRDAAYHAARPDWGCGALTSVGIHAVDAVVWALGAKPVEVHCVKDGDPETEAVMTIRFDNGSLAALRLTFHAGPDRTRLVFAGNGLTATIAGGEADPTASAVEWSPRTDALVALERASGGDAFGPLVVPFIGDALHALRHRRPAIDIASVTAAHACLLGGK